MNAIRALVLAVAATLLPAPAASQVVKVTVTPSTVDNAKREPVSVAAAVEAERPRLLQATKARVDGAEVETKSTATGVTFGPPAVTAPGSKTVTLLDGKNASVAEFQLTYAGAPAPTPAQPAGADTSRALTPEERRQQTELANREWFPLLVVLMFLMVVGPFVFAIVTSVYRGRSEFNADNRPLGLPVGSFRSILAYSLVAYLGFYVLTSVLSVSHFDPPEFLLGIVATVIGFYFGSRSEEVAEKESAAIVRGVVTQAAAAARGAVVKFTRVADGVEKFSRITDVNGRFELTGAAPGKYRVRATVTGATPSDEQEVNLVAGADHEVAIAIR